MNSLERKGKNKVTVLNQDLNYLKSIKQEFIKNVNYIHANTE